MLLFTPEFSCDEIDFRPLSVRVPVVSTVTAILEPAADGTLHLPVPAALRHGKIEVVATLRSVSAEPGSPAKAGGGILERLNETRNLLGPIDPEEDFPDIWLERESRKPDPLE